MKKDSKETSWNAIGNWYASIVGDDGHYYHRAVILPGVLRLLQVEKGDAIVDLACGQGVFARQLPSGISYLGIDAAASLIKRARHEHKRQNHSFEVADLSVPLDIKEDRHFDKGAIILALQNISDPQQLLHNGAALLKEGGKLVVVLNHPCFRIPRQSSWGVDTDKKMQYRRVDRYMTPMEIPIQAHPSSGDSSAKSYSYHWPLSALTTMLFNAGFAIDAIEEWVSDKKSCGKSARMENRAREEFPLFLALRAFKSRTCPHPITHKS